MKIELNSKWSCEKSTFHRWFDGPKPNPESNSSSFAFKYFVLTWLVTCKCLGETGAECLWRFGRKQNFLFTNFMGGGILDDDFFLECKEDNSSFLRFVSVQFDHFQNKQQIKIKDVICGILPMFHAFTYHKWQFVVSFLELSDCANKISSLFVHFVAFLFIF